MTQVDVPETLGTLLFPGFWAMAGRYWKTAAGEYYRSLSKTAFVRRSNICCRTYARKTWPGVAQECGLRLDRHGDLLDDFRIDETENAIHILNAPSPAATSSLAIGEYVADRVAKVFAPQRVLSAQALG